MNLIKQLAVTPNLLFRLNILSSKNTPQASSWTYGNISKPIWRNPMICRLSTQKNIEDELRLLQISKTIVPKMMEAQDMVSVVELIQQLISSLLNQLFHENKTESKKIVAFILQIIEKIEPKLQKPEREALQKSLKELWIKGDQANDISLIIRIDEAYLNLIRKADGETAKDYVAALVKLSEDYIANDQLEKALTAIHDIDNIFSSSHNPVETELRIKNVINYGLIQLAQGNSTAAIQAYEKAKDIIKSSNEQTNLQSYLIAVLECLGDIYKDQLNLKESLSKYEQGLKISISFFETNNIHTLVLAFKVATISFELGKYEQTVQKCTFIQKKLQKSYDLLEEFQQYKEMLLLMGKAYDKQNMSVQAIECFQKYITNAEKAFILEDPHYAQVLHRLIDLYQSEKKLSDALKHLRSLRKYYKAQGNNSGKEKCEQSIAALQSVLATPT